jgi:heat shock protein HslJ
MTARKIAFAMLLAVGLAGCESVVSPVPPATEAPERADAIVGAWQIASLDGAALPPGRMRLQIGSDLKVQGNVVCNRFDGRLQGRLPTLSFTDVVMTTSGCEVELSQRLSGLFSGQVTFEVDGGGLTLRTSKGVWRFERSV